MAGACCRIWTHDRPAVVLGCSQRKRREDILRRLAGRAELVERDSGGGAVLTGPWMVSVSLVLPHGHPWVCDGLIDSYRQLGQAHVAALEECGVPARALSPGELRRAEDACGVRAVEWACFGGLSAWEVVSAEGRKLVGLAQRRQQSGVLLVAGTLIGAANWPLLCEAMGHPEDESALRRRTVGGAELAGRPIEPARFASALMRNLRIAAGVRHHAGSASGERAAAPLHDAGPPVAAHRRADVPLVPSCCRE